ncbi:MAG: FG-GAP-like repeat-containing protein [Terriglobales bacterium]|jgi:hypothetical protein
MRRFNFTLFMVFSVVPLVAASNGIPSVNQPLVPSSVRPGRAGFTLKVNGSAFAHGAVVNWNGAPLATRFVNQGQLRAAVPAANVANAGTVNVTVTNPAPGGGTSSPLFLTVTEPTALLTFAASILNVGLTPAAIAEGDFNNDGKADLAVLNLYQPDSCYEYGGVGTIQLLLGNGAGGFSTASSTCLPDVLGIEGMPVLMAENFGNGNLGVAPEWYSAGEVGLTAYLGNGDGTFSSNYGLIGITDLDIPIIPAFADFNLDGYLDVAFTQRDADFPGIFVYFGSGNGTFGSGVGSTLLLGSGVFAGDFNGDGIQDLAVINYVDEAAPYSSGPLAIVLGSGGGSFVEAATQPTTTLVNPVWVTMGDFNGDGILDMAFADSGSTALTVLLGNGDGTFTQKTGQPAGQGGGFIATADLNGDGKLDLVTLGYNSVLIYLGNGDGTFQTPLEVAVGNGPSQLAIGDFNGDGRLDIAVANSVDNTISLLLQGPAATVSPSSLKFGKEAVGSTSNPRRVTLTNSGSAVLQLSRIVASGDFSEINNCQDIVPIRKSCDIDVVFQPTATGLRTGTITITDNAADSPQVIQLSGTGD